MTGLHLERQRISQIAVVARDFEATVSHWTALLGAGPFFCGEFVSSGYLYRGRSAQCRTSVAFGYLRDMQVQIVSQLDDEPSIYSEILEAGDGQIAFHHTLMLTDDIEADIERYARLEIDVAARFQTDGMSIAFMDTIPRLGIMIELFQMSSYFDEFFDAAHRAHLEWDGSDPLRRHPLGS